VKSLTVSPPEVRQGEMAKISTIVENTGDMPGTYQLSSKINGTTNFGKSVDIAAHSSQTVEYSLSFPAGTFVVEVDGKTASLTVKPTAKSNVVINWLVVGAAVAVVSAVAVLAYQGRRS
jgi:hypothetical protein